MLIFFTLWQQYIYTLCTTLSRGLYAVCARQKKQSVIEEKVFECRRTKSKNSVSWKRD